MIVVDTSALMAILLGEDTATGIIQALSDNELCISAGTLSELLIVASARGLQDELDEMLAAIGAEVKVVDGATARGVQRAFETWGKGRHPAGLNFGDCFAYATAAGLDAPLLYIGDDFAKTDIRAVL